MAKVSFRMASASRESVSGVQTNTTRKIHRSDHTEGRSTTAPSGRCVRKGTRCGHSASYAALSRRSRHQDLREGSALEAFLFDDVQLQMLTQVGERAAPRADRYRD